jgi:hypothetical protein
MNRGSISLMGRGRVFGPADGAPGVCGFKAFYALSNEFIRRDKLLVHQAIWRDARLIESGDHKNL